MKEPRNMELAGNLDSPKKTCHGKTRCSLACSAPNAEAAKDRSCARPGIQPGRAGLLTCLIERKHCNELKQGCPQGVINHQQHDLKSI